MKILCKDRHYRWFNKSLFIGYFLCRHCERRIYWINNSISETKPKLKKHTCKARLKELKK